VDGEISKYRDEINEGGSIKSTCKPLFFLS